MKRGEYKKRYDAAFLLGREHFYSTGRFYPNPFETAPGDIKPGNRIRYWAWMDGAYDAKMEIRVRTATLRGRLDATTNTQKPLPYPARSIEATIYAQAWATMLMFEQAGCPVFH